jgi:hypothetical protein
MEKQLPDLIRNHGFSFSWDTGKVWALDLPIEEMHVSELTWILDLPFWTDGNIPYNLTAREVIANSQQFPQHAERLQKSDVRFPIDIMLNRHGKWLILDGLHRLCKLIIEGAEVVQVRKVPVEWIDKIAP